MGRNQTECDRHGWFAWSSSTKPEQYTVLSALPMNHLYSIVSVLADGHIHSGPALAREIGISRTAVWKAVKTIQSGGLEICAIKGKGYHLPGPRDALNESAISN